MNARWSAVAYLVDDLRTPSTVELFQKLGGSNFGIGLYNGCGGKPDFRGEQPLATVIREVRQESGYTMHNPVLAGILRTKWPQGTPPQEHTWFRTLYIYLCDRYEMTHVPDGEMGSAQEFLVHGLPSPEKLLPYSMDWLPTILKGVQPGQCWHFTSTMRADREQVSFSKRLKQGLAV